MLYDLIIIGAGPAGITASIYAARTNMNFLVITKDIGGQTLWTRNIENYTGFALVTGVELTDKFVEQIEKFKIQVRENESVIDLKKENDRFSVITNKGSYEAKSVIVSSGRLPRKLGIKGEEEYRNKGVAYCATCDAAVFADQDVAVAGGGNAALDSAVQLLGFASKIYILNAENEFRADKVLVEKVTGDPKVVVYHNSRVLEVYGEKFVTGLKTEIGGAIRDLKVEGLFIEVGSIPSSDFLPGVAKDDRGQVYVNCRSETDIEGLFAAGDVTDVPAKQIIVASGEGAKAAISAFNYLARKGGIQLKEKTPSQRDREK
jgi:thioredoxin-disulfide reductase